MQTETHDPLQFASSLGNKLAARARHVCALLGAGVGKACGLPDMAELQEKILGDLEKNDREHFERQLTGRNLEQALSRLRGMVALLSDEEVLDGLTAHDAKQLDEKVCNIISKKLNAKEQDRKAVLYFAAWAGRANYHMPVELFTVNYDLLMEIALEDLQVPYFDGFIGAMEASFDAELVENQPGTDEEAIPSFFVRLWKLHGSVNWRRDENRRNVVRLGQPVADCAAAIYPSETKYEESRRVPFVVLHDRLRRALHQPETILLITGYSFRDDHLNEYIFTAARRRARSEFIVFCKDGIPENLADKAIITPNLQAISPREAILGGTRADWALPESKNLPESIWRKDGQELTLCDFQYLAKYLALSAAHEYYGDNESLRRLIAEPAAQHMANNLQDHA